MPIVPSDLLEVARRLANEQRSFQTPEVWARTIVNRAYYAAALGTREAVRAEYGDSGFDARHRDLSTAMARNADPEVALVGKRLDGLRKLRNRADYDLDGTIEFNHARLRVMDAEYVLASLRKLRGRLPRGIPRAKPPR